MNYGTQRHEPFRHYYGTENRKKGGKRERSLSMHSALCIVSLQPLLQLIHINKSRKYQTHLMHLDASLSAWALTRCSLAYYKNRSIFYRIFTIFWKFYMNKLRSIIFEANDLGQSLSGSLWSLLLPTRVT